MTSLDKAALPLVYGGVAIARALVNRQRRIRMRDGWVVDDGRGGRR